MNIDNITNLTYREKKMFVSRACLMYKKIKNSKNLLEAKIKHAHVLHDSNTTNEMLNLKTMSLFDTILSLLNKDLLLIIKQDFINIDKDPRWYLRHWSKTTYYKLKHEAINQFLFMFYV